jgi:hypothetical protein
MYRTLLVATLCVLCLTSWVAAQPYVSVWGAEASASQAASSWFGNTGMVVVPTATDMAAQTATLCYHYINDPGGTHVISGNYALADWLEVGATYVDGPVSTNTMGNVKLRVPMQQWMNNIGMPDVAVGVADLTNEWNRSFYFVVSKSFPLNPIVSDSPRIALHAGLASNDTGSGPMDGFFGGVEFTFMRSLLVQAEYDGDNINADLRYYPIPGLSVDVGIVDSEFGAGASYRASF